MMLNVSADDEILYQGRFLSLVRRDGWEFATRRGATSVVGLVAVTDDRRMLLVEQFRPPLRKRVIELPAGLVGDRPGEESESQELAARRELLEETGYEARNVRLLTEGPSTAGLTDEIISFYFMTGLVKVGDGGGDDSEEIVVHEVPFADVPNWLEELRNFGCAIDPKIYLGLFWIGQNCAWSGDNRPE